MLFLRARVIKIDNCSDEYIDASVVFIKLFDCENMSNGHGCKPWVKLDQFVVVCQVNLSCGLVKWIDKRVTRDCGSVCGRVYCLHHKIPVCRCDNNWCVCDLLRLGLACDSRLPRLIRDIAVSLFGCLTTSRNYVNIKCRVSVKDERWCRTCSM